MKEKFKLFEFENNNKETLGILFCLSCKND